VLKRRRRTLMRQHKYRRLHRRCCCVRKGGLVLTGSISVNLVARDAAAPQALRHGWRRSCTASWRPRPPEQPGRGEVALPLGGLTRCASHRRQCVC
jgi:hypothetical protein